MVKQIDKIDIEFSFQKMFLALKYIRSNGLTQLSFKVKSSIWDQHRILCQMFVLKRGFDIE